MLVDGSSITEDQTARLRTLYSGADGEVLLRQVYVIVRGVPGWVNRLRDLGLPEEFIEKLERWDDERISRSKARPPEEYQRRVLADIVALKAEVENDSPGWARARRLEYLQDRLVEARGWLESMRSEAGRVILKLRNPGKASIVHFVSALLKLNEQDAIRQVRQLESKIKWLSASEPEGYGARLHQDHIDAARKYPMDRLTGAPFGSKIVCPFHGDTKPSMHVYANNVYCFVCQKSLDPIGWLVEREGIGFADAVRKLSHG